MLTTLINLYLVIFFLPSYYVSFKPQDPQKLCLAYVMLDVSYEDVTFKGTYRSYERVPCLFLDLIIRK